MAVRSFRAGQQRPGVHRPALAANLEVQAVGRRVDVGQILALGDPLALSHARIDGAGVHGGPVVVVLDDDHLAVTRQIAGIYHLAGLGGLDHGSGRDLKVPLLGLPSVWLPNADTTRPLTGVARRERPGLGDGRRSGSRSLPPAARAAHAP